jgi:hypothetical protein
MRHECEDDPSVSGEYLYSRTTCGQQSDRCLESRLLLPRSGR